MSETPYLVTTPELVEEMAKLRTKLSEAMEKRHEGNGALNSALLAFQNTSEEQGLRLEVVEKVMLQDLPKLVRDIEIIKTRIVGDDAMKTGGLIQQMNALDREVQGLTPRLVAVETLVEKVKVNEAKIEAVTVLAKSNAWDLKVMKIVGASVTTVLVGLGGFITWLKATEVIKFLATKGQ